MARAVGWGLSWFSAPLHRSRSACPPRQPPPERSSTVCQRAPVVAARQLPCRMCNFNDPCQCDSPGCKAGADLALCTAALVQVVHPAPLELVDDAVAAQLHDRVGQRRRQGRVERQAQHQVGGPKRDAHQLHAARNLSAQGARETHASCAVRAAPHTGRRLPADDRMQACVGQPRAPCAQASVGHCQRGVGPARSKGMQTSHALPAVWARHEGQQLGRDARSLGQGTSHARPGPRRGAAGQGAGLVAQLKVLRHEGCGVALLHGSIACTHVPAAASDHPHSTSQLVVRQGPLCAHSVPTCGQLGTRTHARPLLATPAAQPGQLSATCGRHASQAC